MATTGLGVAAKIAVDSQFLSLSLGGTHTHQIVPALEDVSGAQQTGTQFTLSAVAAASGGTTVYTGTITGGGSNAFAGFQFTVAGFTNSVNNGTFECTASSTTTLTLSNAAGVVETHAGTATADDNVAFVYISRSPSVATVSASGVITGIAEGGAVVEVSYPAFNNAVGLNADGTYANKIYAEVNVTVGV